MDHEFYMRRCIELGKQAKNSQESPVGSIVVLGDRIIGEGTENVRASNDPAGHAELIAIRNAAKYLGTRYLSDCLLYTTHEPCLMCSYIIRQTKIRTVVFGLTTGEIGGYSSKLPILTDTSVSRWSKPPIVIAGILSEECKNL